MPRWQHYIVSPRKTGTYFPGWYRFFCFINQFSGFPTFLHNWGLWLPIYPWHKQQYLRGQSCPVAIVKAKQPFHPAFFWAVQGIHGKLPVENCDFLLNMVSKGVYIYINKYYIESARYVLQYMCIEHNYIYIYWTSKICSIWCPLTFVMSMKKHGQFYSSRVLLLTKSSWVPRAYRNIMSMLRLANLKKKTWGENGKTSRWFNCHTPPYQMVPKCPK